MSLPRDVREDFSVVHRRIDGNRVVYLDSAATSLKPKRVIDAVLDYYTAISANIHRGKHYLSEEASDRYENARARVARAFGCYGNEVVFVRNTTEALNLVASGLPLEPSDRVVAMLDAHHSLLLPWRRRCHVDVVPVGHDGKVDLDAYAAALSRSPKVVALTHCSNVTGAYAPIEKMTAMAKAAGAMVVVDAAQSVPHRRIDFATLPVDAVAFSSHKMLGPSGVGCLVARAELLARIEPAYVGGGMVDWVDLEGSRPRKIPHRFEAGTPAIEGALGLAAAFDYLDELGMDAVAAHDRELSGLLLAEAAKRDYVGVLGSREPDERAAILTLRIDGIDQLTDVARSLSDAYGIMCRSGHLCAQPFVDSQASGEVLRASAYVYNTAEEVMQLFDALDEIRKSLVKRPR